MIDLSKYNLSEDGKDFVETLYTYLFESWSEEILRYKDYEFSVEPVEWGIAIYDGSSQDPVRFDTFEAFLENFLLDGKPFIEKVNDIVFAWEEK